MAAAPAGGPAPAAPAAACALYEQEALRQAAGETLRPGGTALTERLFQQAGLAHGARLLDLGCGCGASLSWLHSQGVFRTTGVDLSAALLCEAAALRLDVALAPAENLPFSAGSFEAVLLECSLSAALQPEIARGGSGRETMQSVFGEVQRVLQPGGWLLLSDVYARQPGGLPALRALPGAGCLRSLLDLAMLRRALAELGFSVPFWEDHSGSLRQFSGQLTRAYGSQQAFWEQSAGQPVDAFDLALRLGQAKPGYFGLVARKR